MSVYKITFTPSGPYFFGNEKTFSFRGDGKNSGNQYGSLYYIKGEPLPSQTTVLGAIRYLLLEDKTFSNAALSKDRIGAESFNIDSDSIQTFGAIKKVSHVFVCNGKEAFIPTPFDHTESSDTTYTVYTPFSNYGKFDDPDKLYANDYDAKCGLTNSFMSVEDGHIEDSLFSADVRTGINRESTKDGFFKKEYCVLKKGYSFAVYADLDESVCTIPEKDCVMLGQNKVPFSVVIEKCSHGIDEILIKAQAIIKEARKDVIYPDGRKYDFIYCASDHLLDLPEELLTENLYDNTVFAAVKNRDFRNIRTKNNVKGSYFEKNAQLHRLIQAGSIFITHPNTTLTPAQATDKFKNASNIGFNQIITIKE